MTLSPGFEVIMVPNCLSQERLADESTSDNNRGGGTKIFHALSNFIGLKKKHKVMVNPFFGLK
jgi:hypothetical protein